MSVFCFTCLSCDPFSNRWGSLGSKKCRQDETRLRKNQTEGKRKLSTWYMPTCSDFMSIGKWSVILQASSGLASQCPINQPQPNVPLDVEIW